MTITLDHIENIAENIRMFWFKPEHKLDYTAGQYIEMTLPHDSPDDRGLKRWFTLSSSPTEDMLAITTKFAGDTASTFKRKLFSLEPGTEIQISEPMGDFVLPKDTTLPLVFVAGGIGVTPMRSMVKWLTDKSEKRKIHIIYSVTSESQLVFRDLLESYADTFEVFVSTSEKHLHGTTILEMADNNPDQLIFVSGPEPMTEALEAELKDLGVDPSHLVLDFFPGYPIQ